MAKRDTSKLTFFKDMDSSVHQRMRDAARDLKVVEDQVHSDQSPQKPQPERVSEKELTSLYALLAYVAHNENVRQETVQMILEAQFNVDHVAKIRRSDYLRAIEFLVDMKMDDILN